MKIFGKKIKRCIARWENKNHHHELSMFDDMRSMPLIYSVTTSDDELIGYINAEADDCEENTPLEFSGTKCITDEMLEQFEMALSIETEGFEKLDDETLLEIEFFVRDIE